MSVFLSDIDWGPIDALERDEHFPEKWIEPNVVKNCLDPRTWIVSGEKGSGKSAIRVALRDIYKDAYIAVGEIDFKNISFQAVHQNLKGIASACSLEEMPLMSNAWQYVIITELILACADSDRGEYGPLVGEIRNVIGNVRAPANQRLAKIFENMFNNLAAFTTGAHSSNARANLIESAGLSAVLLERMRQYPIDKAFRNLRETFFDKITRRGHRAVVVLDGFDQLYVDSVDMEAINIVFAGLADAVLAIRNYQHIPKTLEVKAIVPHDRYRDLGLRDFDKVEATHASITWNVESLQDLIRKRAALSPKVSAKGFSTIWRSIMPDSVINTRTGIGENTFEYLLRHTMYRPRQLQQYLLELSSDYRGMKIKSDYVTRSVAIAAEGMAASWLKEYEIDYPDLKSLLSAFVESENIITYETLRRRVSNTFRRYEFETMSVAKAADKLYEMGFFGVFRDVEDAKSGYYYPPSKSGKKHHVEFYFKDGRRGVTALLRDDAKVAIHPIFNEYLRLKTNPDFIVG